MIKTREFLRRILPPGWLPYLLHMRPRTWPIAVTHMSAGFLLANGFHFKPIAVGCWAMAALVWVILGNSGTLAINSVFDQDEGDIGYLNDPPPTPRYLLHFSLILMFVGLLLAIPLGWRFLVAYVVCMALSLLYSVPPIRLKARAGLDVLVNTTGYGALTIYAGWAALGRPLEPPIISITLSSFFLIAACYPLSQLYQMAEDRRRGDQTLALSLGRRHSLHFSMVAIGLSFVFVLRETCLRYWQPISVSILLALAGWGAVLLPWYRRQENVDVDYEKRGFYRALWACFLTDLSIVLAMAP